MAYYSDNAMNHGMDQSVFHHGSQMDESEMLMDEQEYGSVSYPMHYQEEDELAEGMIATKAVHQCNVCNKIFVSFKGLQQHAVIHTDQKPYQCDICSKSFRFKSNLFEHRSVHTGFTPHACPYCGKTCRLKGNLKKHLRTHVTTKEELEAAWRPFASNRRPPADIPDDAIIVRGSGGPYYSPQSRQRKSVGRKLGLGQDPRGWIDKIKRGEMLGSMDMVEKVRRLEDLVFSSGDNATAVFESARPISFEAYDCPACKISFMTKGDCVAHYSMEHGNLEIEWFCDKCFRQFADAQSHEQHMSYHVRVGNMINMMDSVKNSEPQILIPTPEDITIMFGGVPGEQGEHAVMDNIIQLPTL